MQVHSPRPFPTQVHRIMWPMSCCLSHWSPTRYMTPSLVVQISSCAVEGIARMKGAFFFACSELQVKPRSQALSWESPR